MPVMEMQIGAVRFDVLDEGIGSTIVLLHGFPLAKETWDAQARALRERARVVRFDLRGLGRSSAPPGPYLMETLAGDVAAVMDALEIERAVIAGHSLGGFVAFAFYRMFAERCAGLGIVCSRANADAPELVANRLVLAERAEREGMEPIAGAFVPRYFAPDVYEREPELVERARAIIAATDPGGAAAMLRGMAARVDSTDLFPEIDVPFSVVAGTSDGINPLAGSRAMAQSVAHGSLHVFECGHFPLWEAPDDLSAVLASLVDEAKASG
jgi:pimeloyl-ACP methyl ester carboxylesterase